MFETHVVLVSFFGRGGISYVSECKVISSRKACKTIIVLLKSEKRCLVRFYMISPRKYLTHS